MKISITRSSYVFHALLFAFLTVGCIETTTKEEYLNLISTEFETIEIDGCEYIYREGYRTGFLAHKGNCKNH
jgi:PBP1b-binding outer membrane lipoprotein LpoB